MSDEIRLVYIQEKDPELGDLTTDLMWERTRVRHAELIRNLEKAGTSIIAFDLFFETPTRDQVAQAGTVELVRAVREINARAKTRVIVGHKSVMDSLPSETWGDVDVVDEESNANASASLRARFAISRSDSVRPVRQVSVVTSSPF